MVELLYLLQGVSNSMVTVWKKRKKEPAKRQTNYMYFPALCLSEHFLTGLTLPKM